MDVLNIIANCVMALAALAVFGLSIYIYIVQRPRVKVDITDRWGNKERVYYHIQMKGDKGILTTYFLICIEIKITQYSTSSILSNIAFRIPDFGDQYGIFRAVRLPPKDPFQLPDNIVNFKGLLAEADKRDLLSNPSTSVDGEYTRMIPAELKGNGIWRLVFITNSDAFPNIPDNGFTSGFISLTIGNKEIKPIKLAPKTLINNNT